jgi:hypothetical protein
MSRTASERRQPLMKAHARRRLYIRMQAFSGIPLLIPLAGHAFLGATRPQEAA